MDDIKSSANSGGDSTKTRVLLIPERNHNDNTFEQRIIGTPAQQVESSYYAPSRNCIVKAPLRIAIKGDIDGEHETYVFKTDGTPMKFITEGYGIGTSFKEIKAFIEFLEIPYTLDSVTPSED